MQFPTAVLLLLGFASFSSCESTHPKLSESVTNSTTSKSDAEADLDALDAADAVVTSRLVKHDTAKKDATEVKKSTAKKAVKKARKVHKVAPQKPSEMPEADEKKSAIYQKEKNLVPSVASSEAEAVLAAGDAKAHAKEDERHQKEVDRNAPARVVHVAASDANKKLDAVEKAKDLDSDLHDLKQRIVSDDKHQKEVEKEQEEEAAEKASEEKDAKPAKTNTSHPQRQANLNKLMKLSSEMSEDANAAPKTKTTEAFLQRDPVDIRQKSGIDSDVADLEATAQEIESHPHAQHNKKVRAAKPADQQYGALSHLKDSILKAKKAQQTTEKEEELKKEKRHKAQAEAAEDAQALAGTVPALDDPRLREVKVTHVKHLPPAKLKHLKDLVGKMQESVEVLPAAVAEGITDLKSGKEAVVGEATVHMKAHDGFGERAAPKPKLPPAPEKAAKPELPRAPPRPHPKPVVAPKKAPEPKPLKLTSQEEAGLEKLSQQARADAEAARRDAEKASPLAPTVVSTVVKPEDKVKAKVTPKLSKPQDNAIKFEHTMHENVVAMHAALRESTRETQEKQADKLRAKKLEEEAALAKQKVAEETKLAQQLEVENKKIQKEKTKALRQEEEQKATAERQNAHQQMLDYRAAQKKARELAEQEKIEKQAAAKKTVKQIKDAARRAAVEEPEVPKVPAFKARKTQFAPEAPKVEEPKITHAVPKNVRPSQFVEDHADPWGASSLTSRLGPKPTKGDALTQSLSLTATLAVLFSLLSL